MSGMVWAAYERVSTEEQAEEGHSIQVQKEAIERYLAGKGDSLYRHYTDAGASGATMERVELQALLADARAGKFQGVVVHKTDRLSRKLRDILNIVESLKEMGIAFWTIDQGYDTTTPQGRLLFHQLASFADFERNMICERTIQGLRKRAELGKYTGANPPYGYDYDQPSGTLVVNEREAAVVREVFRWIAHERLSMRRIALRLAERGVPTKKAAARRMPTLWHTSSLWLLLTNTAYYGEMYYRKTRRAAPKRREGGGFAPASDDSRERRPEAERIRIPVPAIIDKGLFDLAQERMKENQRFSPRNRKYDRPLRSLMYCGECGSRFEPVSFEWNGRRYWKYRCRGRAFPEFGLNCRVPHVKAEPVEEKVWTAFLEALKKPGILFGWAAAEKALGGVRAGARRETTALRSRLNFLRAQEERARAAFRLGGYTPEQFAEEAKRLRLEREGAERELAVMEESEAYGKGGGARADSVSAACRKLYNTAVGMNAAERRECLRLVGARIEVKSTGEAVLTGALPVYEGEESGRGDLSSTSLRRSAAASIKRRGRRSRRRSCRARTRRPAKASRTPTSASSIPAR
ncbi:MAG: recombinase family protein [Elusimicrobia bacterium]|nr:recombinase family protein [Elusimicrobiota bacterium]